MEELEKLRKKIDKIDDEILKALGERLVVAKEIGKIKRESGKTVTDSKRENEVYERINEKAAELDIDPQAARHIFFEIIQLSKSKQPRARAEAPTNTDKIKVAFQGEYGAYSEAAVRKAFPNAEPVPCQSFFAAFEALDNNEVDVALMPVENSTEGSVTAVYDLLTASGVNAFMEVFLRVEHCLIATPGTGKGELKEVYSHPQALEQCRRFIKNMGLKPVPYYDTAGAARMIKESKRKDAAAIASSLAAEHYGMKILEKNIEDSPNNTTRFLALSKKAGAKLEKGNEYKTSLVFAVKHEPGTLFGILKIIADAGINLTKLESRPNKKTPWEYLFFVDFEGHCDDDKVADILDKIKEKTLFMKIFGSYVKGG